MTWHRDRGRPVVSLWQLIAGAGLPPGRLIADAAGQMALRELAGGTTLDLDVEAFRGRSVVIYAGRQMAAALALMELDGIAARLVLCPPDLPAADLPVVIAQTGADILLTDHDMPPGDVMLARCGLRTRNTGCDAPRNVETEWLLFTSGTSGRPKILVHTLHSLAGRLAGMPPAPAQIWSTFYDMRRYGGLQIFLRSCLGGGNMLLSDPQESPKAFFARLGAANVTHISGTPSHWRRALMAGAADAIAPDYVRLSGETADQGILNQLRQAYPAAEIAHAFASTEAGLAFDVRDGLAGFPVAMIEANQNGVALRIEDGSLRIRSPGTAAGYAGTDKALTDADGFVDTGDMLERRGDRYYFIGRREGLINVGGLKVHPEEVEAVMNLHPFVQMSRVWGRRNPITGAIVVADVVTRPGGGASFDILRGEILGLCKKMLPAHKIPAMLCEVAALDVAASGKMQRRHG